MRSSAAYDAVVFSGGGIKGISSLGASHYLMHHGHLKGVGTFVGTSAGAIVAAILATGLDPKHVFQAHVLPFKWKSDIDIGFLDKGFGVDSGASLEAWLLELFDEDLTFRRVRELYKKTLVVCVTNLNRRRAEYFGPDTTPDVPIVKALRMSCSVPVYFSAVQHEGMLYVDGGLCDNFPLDYAYDLGCRRVLGVHFYIKEKPENFKWTVDAFMGAVLESSLSKKLPKKATVIALDCGNTTQPLDFKLPESSKRTLFHEGHKQTALFFKKNM